MRCLSEEDQERTNAKGVGICKSTFSHIFAPWLNRRHRTSRFPLLLAPMEDVVIHLSATLCKDNGADVVLQNLFPVKG
jgi:hypothetical protein